MIIKIGKEVEMTFIQSLKCFEILSDSVSLTIGQQFWYESNDFWQVYQYLWNIKGIKLPI